VTDISIPHPSFAADRSVPAGRQADSRFLRRILFGLIAATIFSGAVTVTLVTQQEAIQGLQVASTYGPA
jgi:hypothetical protein